MKKYFLSLVILLLFIANSSFANNMLIQNVTTTGNNPTNKTIQVQFDMSWDNSWRDSINWDAAWLFIKFKDANGLWQHAQLSLSGYANGNGTANIVKVTSDKVGAWVYRSALGSGTFNSTSMQLQWNYGLNGLNDATGLEVRVFAVEMVYVPEGDFNVAKTLSDIISYSSPWSYLRKNNFSAPGNSYIVVNNRLSPKIGDFNIKIKGEAGLDTNNDGAIDNTNYPIGYKAFYCYKYPLSQQQYADFLNTLTPSQATNLGVSLPSIFTSNNQYFSSNPNAICNNANEGRLFAIADWSGLRPMSFLELNKAAFGPNQPIICGAEEYNNNSFYSISGICDFWSSFIVGGEIPPSISYYGIEIFQGFNAEPSINLNSLSFTATNGNGNILNNGTTDVFNWGSNSILFLLNIIPLYNFDEFYRDYNGLKIYRYVRSAE